MADPPDDWRPTWFAASDRGVFSKRRDTKFRDILDGLSNTIAGGEMITDLGDRDVRSAVSGGNGGWVVEKNPLHCVQVPQIDPEAPGFWCDTAGGSQNCSDPPFVPQNRDGRGMNWAWGAMSMSTIHTIRPPNSEVCFNGWHDNVGTCPPSSRHQGGAHILMADGAVKFITDSIEAGDQTAPVIGANLGGPPHKAGKPSPYGLWGSLGSRGAKEKIEESF